MLLAAVAVAATLGASPGPTPASAAGASAPPDGSYNYSITQDGAEIGKSSLAIKRTDMGVTVHESETMQTSYSFVIDEIFDMATLAPRAYTGVYTRGTDTTTVHAAFDRSGATVTIDNTTGTAPLPNPPGIKDVYVLEGAEMSGFAMLPAQIHASRATQFSQILPRRVIQLVCRVDQHAGAARPSGVPAGDALLSINGQVNFDEWYDPVTFVVHALSVPSQQVLITLTK